MSSPMSSLCGNDTCKKPGTLRCSKCKTTYYCSVTCQKNSWKEHKKSCTTQSTESVQDSTSKIGQVFDNTQKVVPEIHKEYQRRYPDDKDGFDVLRKDYYYKNVIRPMCEFNETIVKFGSQLNLLQKRWACSIGADLFDFLEKAKLGDIFDFYGRPEVMAEKQHSLIADNIQTMRNIPVQVIDVEIGKAYVNIGFVDLQRILFSNLSNPQVEGQVIWFCVEANEICLAKSLVILELIKSGGCSARDILQIWFSTSIGSDAKQALRRCCKSLAEKEKWIKLKKLFSFWSTADLNSKDARKQWLMSSGEATREILLDMENRLDRQETARYLVTGEIFLSDSKEKYGNVTMFSFTQEFSQLLKIEANIFATLDLKMLPPVISSFVSAVEEIFISKMETLRSLLKDDKMMISLVPGIISKNQPDLLTAIRSLKPAVIDWSNIPDYWTNQDFFEIAKKCSVKTTKHTLHFLNWTKRIYGCNIIDYMPVNRNNAAFRPFRDHSGKITKFYKLLEKDYHSKKIKDIEPILRPLHIKSNPPNLMNLTQMMLCQRYIDIYLTHFFKDQNCVVKVGDGASYTPFASANTLIYVSFKFGGNSDVAQCHSEGVSVCDKAGCEEIGTKTCSRCKSTKYCSVDCQKASWEEHKLFCTKFKQ